MIYDSLIYKQALDEELRTVTRRCSALAEPSSPTDVDRVAVDIEGFVFRSGFVVRKLMESNKLSTDFEAMTFAVKRYPLLPGARTDRLSLTSIDGAYDLSSGQEERRKAWKLCNLIVHSWVFQLHFDEQNSLSALWVNSDATRNEAVWRVDWPEFERLVSEVINDDVAFWSYDQAAEADIKLRVSPYPKGVPDDLFFGCDPIDPCPRREP